MSKIWLSEKENQLTKQKLKNSACFKALLWVCFVCGIVALIDVSHPNERYANSTAVFVIGNLAKDNASEDFSISKR